MNIETYSVKVMRSHDYCHFEVVLGGTPHASLTDLEKLAVVDEVRKSAARLADKAVEQYKIAKANRLKLGSEARDRRWELDKIERIKAQPETERTPQDQATLKAHQDEVWEASRRFDYDDQWDDDEAED